MTYPEFVLLTNEVIELQDKYDKTQNGLIRDKLRQKKAILKNVINQEMKPRNPKQELFEAS